MRRPGDYRAVTNSDHHRLTSPMGRPFDGSVPRYRDERDPGQGWPLASESNPYPYGHEQNPNVRGAWRRPIPSHVVRTSAQAPTPPQPQSIYPPEPFISQMETARNTRRIASEIRQIKWIILLVFLLLLALVATEFYMATRISSIFTYQY